MTAIHQTPMSPVLAATLARASDAATAMGAREVMLEHVLGALCDDPDAVAVLDASRVDIQRLKSDIGGYLARFTTGTPQMPGAMAISEDTRRILEAAGAAARGGRRRDINGAIVLAAIVGDERSIAAQMLQAQGLTFDGAIRALQTALSMSAPAATPAAPPPAADDVLARARERVQSRSAPTLRDLMNDMTPRPAPPPPFPGPEPEPAVALVEAPPFAPAPVSVPSAPAQPAAVAPPIAVEPVPLPEVVAPIEDHAVLEMTPMQQDIAVPSVAHEPDIAHAQSGPPQFDAPIEPPRSMPSLVIAKPVDPIPVPLGQPMASAPPPPPPQQVPQQPMPAPVAASAAPPGDDVLANIQRKFPGFSGPPPMPPPLPVPMTPNPMQRPPMQPSPAMHGRPVNPQLGAPSIALSGPRLGPSDGFRGPHVQHAPTQPAPISSAPMRAETRSRAKADTGQLAENIPRAMRIGKTERVEIRVAKASAKAISQGLEGGGVVWRHDIVVTQAMSVRLRAPEGGFFIETASPETQWIENNLGHASDDFASWRFLVTPNERGWSRLQIIVSARTVGADGIMAETAMPDQVVEVRVKRDLKRVALRWLGWIAAAVAGGAFAKFGEAGLSLAASQLPKLLNF